MSNKKTNTAHTDTRAPIVAVVGHIDHGKSTLLDYIRKANVVAGEAGGITQHISAYEASILDDKKKKHTITFLDTPGHEAFSGMRERGVDIADIAILIVSAEDGVKTQTIEAWKSIERAKTPCIVAINKIDKEGANIDKTKQSLSEAGIYVEGFGGDIPVCAISAKVGTGIAELLQTVLLVAEVAELTADTGEPATGIVLESFLDQKRGISATLILEDGYIGSGMFVLAGGALAPTRIMEDWSGKMIKVAECPSPIEIVGFDSIPMAGTKFQVFIDKKAAEVAQAEYLSHIQKEVWDQTFKDDNETVLPLIIKTDVLGRLEAVRKEIEKIDQTSVRIKIISAGVGNISDSDVILAGSDPRVVILGLGVKLDNKSRDQVDRLKTKVELFDIIYKLTERLAVIVDEATPKTQIEETTGSVKIIKVFSVQKDKQVIGGRVETGSIVKNSLVKIIRRGVELGRGKLVELQSQKIQTNEVNEGTDCGMMVESKFEIAGGDVLESYKIVTK